MFTHAAWVISATLLLSNAWFYQAGGWNQNSRLDLVRAIVEQNVLHIDAYHQNTGDKAVHDGHVYSDKAPGLALAAAPVAAVARPMLAANVQNEESYARWLSYVLTLAGAGLPAALTGALVVMVARRLGFRVSAAAFAALAFGLATPAWAYATLFMGHALATAALFAAFAAGLALESIGSRRRDALLGVAVGFGAGWATITEYPSAPPALALAALALAQVWRDGWARRARVAGGIAAAAAPALLVLAIYNQLTFGRALTTGYHHLVQGFGGMQEGFMGVQVPQWIVLRHLLIGGYRGLFFHAPILLVALCGLSFLLTTRGTSRRAASVALLVFVYYALFNASYYYWTGGWSYGPRHMAPALPFLALGLAPLWSSPRNWLRTATAAIALLSAANTLAAVSTTPQPPEGLARPLLSLAWPAFLEGDLSLNHQSVLEAEAHPGELRGGRHTHDAFNVGELFGLSGLASLVPLLLAQFAAGLFLARLGRRRLRIR